ncbi:MAG: hypothetical protein ACRECH_17540 [Nitrososphaerales archaeon]
MKALGIKLEFIYYHTPEQNGHIESIYKTLKKSIYGVRISGTIRRQRSR